MRARHYLVTVLSLTSLLLAIPAAAQTPRSASGHWEGTIQVPEKPVSFQLDLAENAAGALTGAISFPGEHIKGLPLAAVALDGSTMTFHAREDQQFTGTLSEDGAAIAGALAVGEHRVPVTMTRTGAADIAAPPTISAVPKALDGDWHATVGSRQMRLLLKVANRADGTASASLINLDEGNLTIPVSAIVVNGASVTFDLGIVGASLTASLNGQGELAGTFSQGAESVPITFVK